MTFKKPRRTDGRRLLDELYDLIVDADDQINKYEQMQARMATVEGASRSELGKRFPAMKAGAR